MRLRPRTPLAAVALAAALVALAVAGAALADVLIYKNNFSSRSEVREVKPAGGKRCDKGWREKTEALRVTLRNGPDGCSFKPPVQGSAAVPDHIFEATGKVTPDTARIVRNDAYLAVAVRAGGGNRYELRVFPKDKTYQLKRDPTSGPFPAQGPSDAIKGIGDRNELRLRAVGSRLRAFVNGAEVADVNDPNPGQVDGTKVEFTLGSVGNADRTTEGVFQKLKLSVPNP